MCYTAFSVPVRRSVGTANLTGENKSMVIMQEKMERKESDEPAETEMTEWHGR